MNSINRRLAILRHLRRPPRAGFRIHSPRDLPTGGAERPQTGGYQTNSIVPPGQQGIDGDFVREQVGEEPAVNEEHLKSTPPSVAQHQTGSIAKNPTESPNQSPFVSLPNSPPTQTQPRDTEPVSYPPDSGISHPVPNDSHSDGGNPFDSIASPGQHYVQPVPAPAPTPVASVPSAEPPTKVGGAVAGESKAQALPNGLYFHTGQDVAFVAKVIEHLSAELKPLYCVDLSRLEPERNTPSGQASKATAKTETVAPAKTETVAPAKSNSSFELEDAESHSPFDDSAISDSEVADSPFADSVKPPEDQSNNAEEVTQPTPPEPVIGVPLFTFLPPDLQHNGPVLRTADEFPCRLPMFGNRMPLPSFWR